MMDIVNKLSRSVNDLEYSVMQAYDSFLNKYGAGSLYVSRLESYFSAIDKQRVFIDELERCVLDKNYTMTYHIANKIVAISEMIKNDARSLLFSINSDGTEHKSPDDSVNETIH